MKVNMEIPFIHFVVDNKGKKIMKKRQTVITIIMIVSALIISSIFLILIYLDRKQNNNGVPVTMEIIGLSHMDDTEYQIQLDDWDNYEDVLKVFGLENTKTALGGFPLGTFHSKNDYKVGDKVKGYLYKDGSRVIFTEE